MVAKKENFKNPSKIYMIYELKESLPEGISKNEELLEIENDFLKVIKDSGKYDKFKFMLEDWETQKTNLEGGIKVLKARLLAVEALMKMYQTDNADESRLIGKVVDLTLSALGIGLK